MLVETYPYQNTLFNHIHHWRAGAWVCLEPGWEDHNILLAMVTLFFVIPAQANTKRHSQPLAAPDAGIQAEQEGVESLIGILLQPQSPECKACHGSNRGTPSMLCRLGKRL